MADEQRNDPYVGFRFHVEIDGLIVAGFSEVSGLSVEIETEDLKEGGVNDHIHKMIKGTKYEDITLKRGLTDSDTLWKWVRDTADRKIDRKTGRIILYDSQGNETWHWVFEEAVPIKWSGPDFQAGNSGAAIETLVLAHEGLKKG